MSKSNIIIEAVTFFSIKSLFFFFRIVIQNYPRCEITNDIEYYCSSDNMSNRLSSSSKQLLSTNLFFIVQIIKKKHKNNY